MKPLQGARDSYVEARNKILLESNGLNAAAGARARARSLVNAPLPVPR